MNLPVAQKFRIFESRNQPKNSRLLSKLQVILKSDKIVRVRAKIFAAKLNHRVRNFAAAWVSKPHRFHGAEAQRVASTTGELFDGKTTFKVVEFFPFWSFNRLGSQQRIIEAVIFLFRERTIDVVCRAFVVAGCEIDTRVID